MKKILSRVTAALLVILCAAAPLSSCKKQEETTKTPETFQITADYVVIRSDTDDEYVPVAQLVYQALNELTGLELNIATDYVKRGEEVTPGQFEILVGSTNRKDSIENMASMSIKDYLYQVKSANVILITGGSADAAMEAAKKFLFDMFGYTGEGTGTNKPLTVGAEYKYAFQYPVQNLTFNQVNYTEYSIVVDSVDNAAFADAATTINNAIETMLGRSLPVVTASELKTPHQICITTSARERSDKSHYSYELQYENDNCYLVCHNETIDDAVQKFVDVYLTNYDEGTTEVLFNTKTYEGYTFGMQANGLVFKNVSDSGTVIDGVDWSIRNYKDENGKPVVAYVMEIDPDVATLVIGTPDNSNEYLSGKLQYVKTICEAAEEDGLTVLGSVNGDLYYYETDCSVLGVCVKNGIVIQEERERFPFFAIMKDGSPFIGFGEDLNHDFSDVWQAVGGRGYVLKDGSINDIMWDVDFAYIRHPRTSIGFREDGTLLLVVVDGRQPDISNGASFADLALIYKELGAKDAVNIDGGGSSIFYIHDQKTGEYRYLNSPSDGSPRVVANCTMVVLKDQYSTYQGD